MSRKYFTTFLAFALFGLISSCASTDSPKITAEKTPHVSNTETSGKQSFQKFQADALKFNSTIRLPDFDTKPAQIRKTVTQLMKWADAEFDKIGAQDPAKVTFQSVMGKMNEVSTRIDLVFNQVYISFNASTDKAVREAAQKMVEAFEKWSIKATYREDLYKVTKALADQHPKLSSVDQRLLDETMKSYKRNGLHLPKDVRNEVEKLKGQLSKLELDFQSNINNAKNIIKFSGKELDGISDESLKKWKVGPNQYQIDTKVFSDYIEVLRNAKVAETRRRIQLARETMATAKNAPILKKVFALRAKVAKLLGYPNWASVQLEDRMAKNPKTVNDFLNRLNKGLEPKVVAEMEELRQRKATELGKKDVKLDAWDLEYYYNLLSKEKYDVDQEAIKEYFPMEQTLQAMFRIYEKIFGLKFYEVEAPYKWSKDIQLFVTVDAKTGEPLGAFYLDLYPREGKYNHFAHFDVISGTRLADGTYQRPVAALICNFPKPNGDQPSLLIHDNVETLFHEFGHAMHNLTTRAEYMDFSGTNVPRDFVEAPSQMLENWVWDKDVLDTFAVHYKDSSKRFPKDLLARMDLARKAQVGREYRRQIALGKMDMAFHEMTEAEASKMDPVKISNDFLEAALLIPPQKGTTFITRFGHLLGGYDAGYYGYLWSKAISSDMASVFKKSSRGFLDEKVGMKLRNEIYAVGNSRDIDESVRKFLGRDRSIEPLLEELGIEE